MFRPNQILTATALVKKYKQISKWLRNSPQALLITQKDGEKLVLVNAEIFMDLCDFRMGAAQSPSDFEDIGEKLYPENRI